MKKIISLCLALACVLPMGAALTSCSSEETPAVTTAPSNDPASTTGKGQIQKPLDNDYAPSEFPTDGVYIDYVSNNSKAGSVTGGGLHRVDQTPAGSVTATPNLGYRFTGWSDGVTEATRSGDAVSENTQIVAIFAYESLELPILCIDTDTGKDVKNKTDYLGATLSVFNTDKDYCLDDLDMQIRGRGNKTWEYEKKSYKLKLSEKQSLLGLGEGKSKKWVLLANVCDQSLLRNYLALKLAAAMPSAVWSPDCTSVDVYLNGQYRGVYLLCEEIDANKNKVDVPEDLTGAGTDDFGFLVEISGNPKDPAFECNERNYQIHSDLSTDSDEAAAQQAYIKDYLRSAWNAVRGGNEKEIAQWIDIDSMVNAYLVEEILKNLDCGYDSFYLYRQKGGKLTFGPLWDFDNALGNADEGTENYYDLYVAYDERFQSNPWLYTAMKEEWFRSRVVEMWEASKAVCAKMSDTVIVTAKAGFESYCRNFEKWQLFGRAWNRETVQITSLLTYEEHYEFLAEWIDKRLDWMDEYYHEDSFIPSWDSTPINPENPWQDWPGWGGGGNTNKPANGHGNDDAKKLEQNYSTVKVSKNSVSSTVKGNSGEGVGNLFDQSNDAKYCCMVGNGNYWNPKTGTVEITFKTSSAVRLAGYSFTTAFDTNEFPERNPETWVLYAKDENGNWVEIDSSSAKELDMGAYSLTTYGRIIEGNRLTAQEYKLVITHAGYLQIAEMHLYR